MPRFENDFDQWEFEQKVLNKMRSYKWHDKSRGYRRREWTGTEDEWISYANKLAERNRLLWDDLVHSAHDVDNSLKDYYKKHTKRKPLISLRRRSHN